MVLARTTAALAHGAVLAVMLLLPTGCSGSDAAQPMAPVPGETSSAGRVSAPPSTIASTVPNTARVAPEPVTSEPPFVTVPDEPVPGLDSDDPFCRAWSQFAGSFQALALASGVGADATNALRLEVAAAGAVMGAVGDLGASMPADLDDERDAFLAGLLGPFANRASLASETMSATGLTAEQIDELGDLWLVAIAASASPDPDLVLEIPSRYQPGFDDAVASFSADVVPISDDAGLVTDADAPQTLAYIAATCPDQGILSGNDSIDG